MPVIEKRRLYHFTHTKWALVATKHKRLKASALDALNDVFENFAYQSQTLDEEETAKYFQWRISQDDRYSSRLLCLSETCADPLMWGHYADKGRGVCLGFDVKGAIRIEYNRYRVEPGCPIRKKSLIGFGEQVFVKSNKWEYEREWRIWEMVHRLHLCPTTGFYFFPFGPDLKLREILIGPRCEEDNIRYRLEKLTADYDPKPQIICMYRSPSHFSIVKRQ